MGHRQAEAEMNLSPVYEYSVAPERMSGSGDSHNGEIGGIVLLSNGTFLTGESV
jgi:hypothetical protein